MNARRLITRAAICVLTCILVIHASLLPAITLTWVGDVDTGWGTDNAGDTNWSGDQLPMPGDDLIFLSSGNYSGNLDLGGNTYEINSITVGDSGDTAVNGLSDFLVTDRTLAQNGTIRLGAAGITANMVVANGAVYRDISFDADIELNASSVSILRDTNAAYRRLFLDGTISSNGGVGSTDLTLKGFCCNTVSGISLGGSNTFTGDITQKGEVVYRTPTAYGNSANKVFFDPDGVGTTSNYFVNTATGPLTTAYDFSLNSGGTTILYRASATPWTLTGDLTGGGVGRSLDIFNSTNSGFIFTGTSQDFFNNVNARTGTRMTIANATAGVAWPNAGPIRLNWTSLAGGQTDLLLRGDYTLNQNVTVVDNTSGNQDIPVRLGQVNDGGTPFDAIFAGHINVLDDDAQILLLTADSDGSSTFNGAISILGGGFGFDKIGNGTVMVNNRVSQDIGGVLPIGNVNVVAGTLQVNSPNASGGFNASMITVDAGATLSGTGNINGNVVSNGTVAPGASIGTLTVDGNVDIFDTLSVETDSLSSDLLDVSGILTLDGSSILRIFGSLNLSKTYTLAQAGTLTGTFSQIFFNDVEVLPGEAIGGTHNLLYLDNAIVLQGVPEPSSLLLLGMGVCLLARRGRRHDKRRVA